jgi:hypothetical protein
MKRKKRKMRMMLMKILASKNHNKMSSLSYQETNRNKRNFALNASTISQIDHITVLSAISVSLRWIIIVLG